MTDQQKQSIASHAATLEATAKGLRELIAADAPVVEPPKPEPKPEPPPVIEVPNDLSGYVMKPGEILDLKGARYFVKTKAIQGAKGAKVINGTLDNQQPVAVGAGGGKYGFAAIEVPKGADDFTVDEVCFYGTSYNGGVKCWANNLAVTVPIGFPGLGWLIQLIGVQAALVKKPITKQLRRGGIFIDAACNNVTIDDGLFEDAGEEAPIRFNGGKGHLVKDTTSNNLAAVSKKEAVQFRGGEITVRACTFLGSAAYGQQPNGQPLKAIVTLKKCTIYGYNRMEAGSEITFEGGEFVNRPEWKGYKLALAGGGELFSLQGSNALGLPKAICTVRDARLDAAKISGGIKPTLINCVDPAGKAVTA